MKDECASHMITEVVALRSKCYTYKTTNNEIGKRLKGLKVGVTNKEISFDNYKDCLFKDITFEHKQKTFKSTLHKVTTI
jgi:hypothetical protein